MRLEHTRQGLELLKQTIALFAELVNTKLKQDRDMLKIAQIVAPGNFNLVLERRHATFVTQGHIRVVLL